MPANGRELEQGQRNRQPSAVEWRWNINDTEKQQCTSRFVVRHRSSSLSERDKLNRADEDVEEGFVSEPDSCEECTCTEEDLFLVEYFWHPSSIHDPGFLLDGASVS